MDEITLILGVTGKIRLTQRNPLCTVTVKRWIIQRVKGQMLHRQPFLHSGTGVGLKAFAGLESF